MIGLAQDGLLAGATIINDRGLANRLAEFGVPYVLFREVTNADDSHEPPYGDNRDIQRGRDEWRKAVNQQTHSQLHPDVIMTPWGHCEKNYRLDGFWYLGIQQAAYEQRRRVGIFTDSVGNPFPTYRDENGETLPQPTWTHRVDSGCMRYGKAHGNFYVYHGYGFITKDGHATNDPGSAQWRDPQGNLIAYDNNVWSWYGGAHEAIYRDLIPEDSQMPILLGEVGASASDFKGIGGVLGIVNDMRGYLERLKADPWVKCWMYWTFGGAPRFDYSCMDAAAPQIAALARSYDRSLWAIR